MVKTVDPLALLGGASRQVSTCLATLGPCSRSMPSGGCRGEREWHMIKLSGITPSGHVHLGNHLGAVRRWAAEGGPDDLYFVSDLHAMTTAHNPARLRSLATEQLAVLVAA